MILFKYWEINYWKVLKYILCLCFYLKKETPYYVTCWTCDLKYTNWLWFCYQLRLSNWTTYDTFFNLWVGQIVTVSRQQNCESKFNLPEDLKCTNGLWLCYQLGLLNWMTDGISFNLFAGQDVTVSRQQNCFVKVNFLWGLGSIQTGCDRYQLRLSNLIYG
jgi:hypothetical protein